MAQFRRYSRVYNAMEALDMILANDGFIEAEVDVVILPPDKVDELTDEEEVNDETIGTTNQNTDVSGSVEVQVNADKGAAITFLDETNAEITMDIPTTSEFSAENVIVGDELPTFRERNKVDTVEKFMKEAESVGEGQWKEDIDNRKIPLPGSKEKSEKIAENERKVIEECSGKEPHEVFEMFCDKEFKNMIIENSERYARQKNDMQFSLDDNSLSTFTAIMMLTGYNTLPRQRLYWEKEPDSGLGIVYNAMSRKNFETIKKYMHFSDNDNLNKSDKFAKVRKLYDITNTKITQFGFFHTCYSIDEQMVPYTGSNGSKQTIREKSVRFGYKNFVLASSDGYPYWIDPYCGKKYSFEKSTGLTTRTVLDCIARVDDWSDKEVFFDNWFNSYKLINVLTSHGISATGTVNVDRVGNAPVISKKELGRKDRGTIVSCQETKTGICITQWLDNGPVAVISNTYGITKSDQVKRWSKKTKSYVYMTRPKCVERYNKHMGGVDQLDALVAVYRINIRGKKWYWPHFINTIDILKSAAYYVYKKANPDNRVDELAFVRSIVCFYLQRSAAALDRPSLVYPRKKSWKGGNAVSEEIRTSFTHFIQKSGTQKRCRVCPKTTRTVCEVNVGLCLEPCFKQYHTSAAH